MQRPGAKRNFKEAEVGVLRSFSTHFPPPCVGNEIVDAYQLTVCRLAWRKMIYHRYPNQFVHTA